MAKKNPVRGFIYRDAQGWCLSFEKNWRPYSFLVKAYVHKQKPAEMKGEAEKEEWDIQPVTCIPATWNGEVVTLTGEEQAIA